MIRHDDPLELFRAAVAALNAGDYATVVSLCDPVSVRAFRRTMLSRFAPPPEPVRQWTADDYMRHDPQLPRAVAEHYVAQVERQRDRGDQLRFALPGVRDYSALEEMDAGVVFASWLEGCAPQTLLNTFVDDGALPEGTRAQINAAGADFWNWIPLGAVPDGPRIAHIVCRHADTAPTDLEPEWDEELKTYPADERALAADLRVAGPFVYVQPCRRQPDGSWLLVAQENFMRPDGMAFMVGEEPADDSAGES